MGKINVLAKQVAELVAAGEVVERPSSIVKELLENSVDASATMITLEIKSGGIDYIRVTDNGTGIEADDVKNAFLRHATSKICLAEDLDAIFTLGFRGEALSSVAAMCRVEMITRTENRDIGVRYVIEGAEETEFDEVGASKGTTIIVRDIFFNTPARMKFLKKNVAEGNNISVIVEKIAAIHPNISVKFIRDGKTVMQSPGNGDMRQNIHAVMGSVFAQELLSVDYEENYIKIEGYISSPQTARANRSYQNFFINSRYVKSQTCYAAIEQAYKDSIMTGKYPTCILNIKIPPDIVDVNVHPAKIEVRFSDERAVFHIVYTGCKMALMSKENPLRLKKNNLLSTYQSSTLQSSIPKNQQGLSWPSMVSSFKPRNKKIDIEVEDHEKKDISLRTSHIKDTNYSQIAKPILGKDSITKEIEDKTIYNLIETEDIQKKINNIKASKPISPSCLDEKTVTENKKFIDSTLPIKMLGEIFSTYIVIQTSDKMVLIDKHAAHERIIYEKLIKQGVSQRQILLEPLVLKLSLQGYGAIIGGLNLVEDLGFNISDYGDGMIAIRECPMILEGQDVSMIIEEIAEKLFHNKNDLTPEAVDTIIYSMACKSAIRAGDNNSKEELEELVRKLCNNTEIQYCPHGRPIMLEFTKGKLEKLFGRLG